MHTLLWFPLTVFVFEVFLILPNSHSHTVYGKIIINKIENVNLAPKPSTTRTSLMLKYETQFLKSLFN